MAVIAAQDKTGYEYDPDVRPGPSSGVCQNIHHPHHQATEPGTTLPPIRAGVNVKVDSIDKPESKFQSKA